MNQFIELLEKLHCGQILASTILVGYPVSRFAGIIKIKHAGYSIHTHSVDVIDISPEHGISQQEGFHLISPVIENQGAPIPMFALARIFMLIEMRPVKVA